MCSKLFQSHRGSRCTYPCFPGVLLTSTLHNTHHSAQYPSLLVMRFFMKLLVFGNVKMLLKISMQTYRKAKMLFSILFQSYCSSQYTSPYFLGVSVIIPLHNILPKPLAAFPYSYHQTKISCVYLLYQYIEKVWLSHGFKPVNPVLKTCMKSSMLQGLPTSKTRAP